MHSEAPPSLAGAELIVAANTALVVRAVLPTGLLALLLLPIWLRDGEGLVLGVMVALGLVSVVRMAWWWRRFAVRELLATPTHLVLRSRSTVERWMAWEDMDTLYITHSDVMPEWGGRGHINVDWFHVSPSPLTASQPQQAILTAYGDMLISRAKSEQAAERVRRAAARHGVVCEDW